MSCYQPNHAWLSDDLPRRVTFKMPLRDGWTYTQLPCGKCAGCRRRQARDWTIRIVHEAEYHENSCFLTLTYNDENVPKDGCLNKRDLQLFFKRLRKDLHGRKIRYFACGEYGEQYERPHYHVILFGLDFANDVSYTLTDLETLWGKGYVSSGTVTAKSAAYVAGYVQKKLDKQDDYCDKTTGVFHDSEFVVMSRRPGIGDLWITKNHKDTYHHDEISVGYQKSKPPRFYDKFIVKTFGEERMSGLKAQRVEAAQKNPKTKEQLSMKEKIAKAKLLIAKRGYEK